jgi:hypothetical protein
MWAIGFALPNLDLREPVGNDYIAIVPRNDSRLSEITVSYPVAKHFVEGFRDQFGGGVSPSFLITSESACPPVDSIEPIIAFRNVFALAVMIEAHLLSLDRAHMTHPHYSDYFDLYPLTCSRDYDGLISRSPAILGFSNETEAFSGQTSPALGWPRSPSLGLELELHNSLMRLWALRFVRGVSRRLTTYLFRSLEMAYEASALPFTNHSTLYDYGSRVSLWISAFEILSHPRTRRGKANLRTVLDLLGDYDWVNKTIGRRAYRVKYGKKVRGINLVQRLYKELYNARNDFLHGNPVGPEHLYPFGNTKRPPLTRFAPLIYKVALHSFLRGARKPRKRPGGLREYARRSANEYPLADQILKSIGA